MSDSIPLIVVDSSVAYKWFSAAGESFVDAALDLLWGHARGEVALAAPAHMPAEVLNGLRYAKLDVEHLRRVPEKLCGAEVTLFPLDTALLSTALDLALTYDLTIHDALFPALAIRLHCGLVTADRAQTRVTQCPVRLLA